MCKDMNLLIPKERQMEVHAPASNFTPFHLPAANILSQAKGNKFTTANKFEMFTPPRSHFILVKALFPFPKICANALLLPIQVEALDGQSGTRTASELFC
jgi:hypothetical protein